MKKVRVVRCLICFLFVVVLLTPCALAASSKLYTVSFRCSSCRSIRSVNMPCGCSSISVRCSNCGTSDIYYDLFPHIWQETGRIEPTAESEGSIAYECSRCRETKSESIPKLEPDPPEECVHNWVETDRTEPTTESEGSITYSCFSCGETKSESIPKLEECIHKWKETDRIGATTTTPGQITYVCQKCGLVEIKSIPVRPVYDETFMNWLGSVVRLFNMTMNEIIGFQATEFFTGVLVFMTMFSLLAKLIQQGRRGRL